MNKPLSFAILIVGVVLLLFGLNAQDSLASNAKEVSKLTPEMAVKQANSEAQKFIHPGAAKFFKEQGLLN